MPLETLFVALKLLPTKNQMETPMMQQYKEVRSGLPLDTLVLFRLGDFFELFNNDAVIASQTLGLTLTQRHGTPMAGIPHVSLDTYVGKLLSSGKKVAVCDQMERSEEHTSELQSL